MKRGGRPRNRKASYEVIAKGRSNDGEGDALEVLFQFRMAACAAVARTGQMLQFLDRGRAMSRNRLDNLALRDIQAAANHAIGAGGAVFRRAVIHGWNHRQEGTSFLS